MIRVSLLLLFSVLVLGDIVQLGNPFFESLEARPGPWVVVFGNKRCAFSNAFNIVFERANVEAEMHPELFPCSFGFIDCPHNPRICKFFNVTNTPKVLYIDSNYEKAYKYKQGSGNVNEFESFLKGDFRYEQSFEIGDIDSLFEEDFTFKEAKYFMKNLYLENQTIGNILIGFVGITFLLAVYFWVNIFILVCCQKPRPKPKQKKQ